MNSEGRDTRLGMRQGSPCCHCAARGGDPHGYRSGSDRLADAGGHELEIYDSVGADAIGDAGSQEILAEIRRRRTRIRLLWPALLVPLLLALVHPAVAALAVVTAPAAAIADTRRRKTVLVYDVEDESHTAVEQFYAAIDELSASSKIWNVEALLSTGSARTSGGAETTLRREPVNITYREPPFLATNLSVPSMPAGRQTLYFMPDRLFVEEKGAIGAVSYQDLGITRETVTQIEHDEPPSDATRVGETWLYVNKDGTPDRRFKNNRLLPVMQYQLFHCSSPDGLNEKFMVSRSELKLDVVQALDRLRTAQG